jgi:bis(5'-nucleosyl)-tetraphosphatase (symmetrical)
MATWAIGDIQGCMTTLEALLAKAAIDLAQDRIWLVGDLVNRGPRSLDVLRWAVRHDHAITAVLGNHDLHLLGRVAGTANPKKRDTLDDVLAAPDRDELVEWLRRRPLVHVEDDWVMVHGGLHPRWSAKKARKLGREIEEGLAGDDWRTWIAQLAGKPARWDEDLEGGERVRTILGYLVRVRCLDAHEAPDTDFDDHPRKAPKTLHPWFEAREPAWADHTVIFGHWAMLGLSVGIRHVGLDSACVWGGQLTAMRLDDRYVVQAPSLG